MILASTGYYYYTTLCNSFACSLALAKHDLTVRFRRARYLWEGQQIWVQSLGLGPTSESRQTNDYPRIAIILLPIELLVFIDFWTSCSPIYHPLAPSAFLPCQVNDLCLPFLMFSPSTKFMPPSQARTPSAQSGSTVRATPTPTKWLAGRVEE